MDIVVFEPAGIERPCVSRLTVNYLPIIVSTVSEVEDACSSQSNIILFNSVDSNNSAGEVFQTCSLLHDKLPMCPITLLFHAATLTNQVDALTAGCDDVIDCESSDFELNMRLEKSVINHIANRQLTARVEEANQVAYDALASNNDLGVNIHFFLQMEECKNFDELGLLLFEALAHYRLTCSVQMRGTHQIKDMEPNGLSRELESRLMFEFKNAGRHVQIAERCIMNYGQVSILIKSMPFDEKTSGMVRDNVFSLLQAVDARIKTLDAFCSLEEERDFVSMFAGRVQHVVGDIINNNHSLMKQCENLVKDVEVEMHEMLQFCDLSENEELKLRSIIEKAIEKMNQKFVLSGKIDEHFAELMGNVNEILQSKSVSDIKSIQELASRF